VRRLSPMPTIRRSTISIRAARRGQGIEPLLYVRGVMMGAVIFGRVEIVVVVIKGPIFGPRRLGTGHMPSVAQVSRPSASPSDHGTDCVEIAVLGSRQAAPMQKRCRPDPSPAPPRATRRRHPSARTRRCRLVMRTCGQSGAILSGSRRS